MSNTDSFIEEVNEEVRRDRLFALMRRYGWIAVAAVLLIVGGASWNEYRKSQDRAQAEATGDALLAALGSDTSEARIQALRSAELASPEAEIVRQMLLSGAQLDAGSAGDAAESLNVYLNSAPEISDIYRDLAVLKAALAATDENADMRRLALETLSQPGRSFALIASEQLALMDLEDGNRDAALERFQSIVVDAAASAGLRQRVSQLIVALGEVPETLPTAGVGQTDQ